MPAEALSPELTDAAFKLLLQGGPFAGGCIFATLMYWMTGREARKERNSARKAEVERFRVLQSQIAQQQDRIQRLHSDKAELLNTTHQLKEQMNGYRRRIMELSGGTLPLQDN